MTITHRSQFSTSTQRDSWVEVNLSKLERNFLKLKDIVKTNIMAIVKADAYGHGACAIAPILQSLGVHSFGVATIDEGIALRNAGIKTPILMLGATPFWSYDQCIKNKITITVYTEDQISLLEDIAKKAQCKIPVQIKIDTGMNRLGVDYKRANDFIGQVLASEYLKLEGIFSHLSSANDLEFSKTQKERFDSIVGTDCDQYLRHIANSYAGINYPEFRYDLVRIGIALFGQEYSFLEPIISIKSRITEIHKISKGESVSYDRTWTAKEDSLIATIPIGYADGVDKRLSNKLKAVYKDNYINQVGNITMDQMMFDISKIKDPKINDVITLIGKENSKELLIADWAKELDTISWELLCRLKLRMPRIYTRD